MSRQSPKSNDTELQFAVVGATLNVFVCSLIMIALWQLFVLLTQLSQLNHISHWVLAEVK